MQRWYLQQISSPAVQLNVLKYALILIILWFLLMMVTALACTQQEPPLQQPEAEGPVNDYEGIIRFHVIANSDSAEDQDLKLLVRNCVIVKLQNALQGAEDVAATRKYIEENTEEIKDIRKALLDVALRG